MGSVVKTIKSASALPAEGFENYLSETSKISVPFTQIQNRVKIINLAADGGVRFGINRIMTQQIKKAQGEFGPNGENVSKVSGDKFDQIRFVGNWVTDINVYGSRIVHSDGKDAYMEVTFYGTGLNYLTDYNISTNDLRVSIDGGAEGSSIVPNSHSGVLSGRNYSPNVVTNVVTGLPLGVHTVKIRSVAGSAWFVFHGLEILNESAQLDVRPNTTYIKGEAVSIAQQSIDFNSNFTNVLGSAGTKGGRVLVYSDDQGIVKKDIRYVEVSQANMAATDHSNEEVIRNYHFREFGSGRGDDFSTLAGTTSDRAFTLDDGTTTLACSQLGVSSAAGFENGLAFASVSSWTLTFVGTGIDVVMNSNSTTTFGAHTWLLDGVDIGTATPPTSNGTFKICSGLPYGTHTLKFSTTSGISQISMSNFIIYQPKTPILPVNSIELSTYNIMADYSATIAGTSLAESDIVGTLFKSNMREHIYTGSVGNIAFGDNFRSGFRLNQTAAGATFEYTFFGTGVVFFIGSTGTGVRSINLKIDNINQDSANLLFSNSSNDSNGNYSIPNGDQEAFEITNLPLGLHTIKITDNSSAGLIYFEGVYVITPIHSIKQNKPTIQNAIEIGSQAISDSRNFKSYNIDDEPNWVQARATSGSITTTATSEIPMPGMIAHIKTNGKPIEIDFLHVEHGDTNGMFPTIYLYLDGKEVQNNQHRTVSAGADIKSQVLKMVVPISAGFHTVQIFWATPAGGGTLTSYSSTRTLTVKELK